MPTADFALRLLIALLLGASIGFERQWRQKSAGLRTNTLVSLGSAAYILLSLSITGKGGDPTRIASQIVTGIGFLGAGVIMKDGVSVQGLNTAATIWCSAAVGALVGVGMFAEAVLTTVAIMLTHLLFRPLGVRLSKLPFFPKSEAIQTEYILTIICKEIVGNHIRELLMQQLTNDDRLLLRSLSTTDEADPGSAIIVAEILATNNQDSAMERMCARLTVEINVIKVSWKIVGQHSDL
jgi:putative Mg2+ transporter-C (MgtC) family protein